MDSTWAKDNALLVAGYFVFGFVAARFLLDRYVFRFIAVWLLSCQSRRQKVDGSSQAKIAKCTESLWKRVYYASVEAWILSTVYNETWCWDTKEYFRGWADQELKFYCPYAPCYASQIRMTFWCQRSPTCTKLIGASMRQPHEAGAKSMPWADQTLS